MPNLNTLIDNIKIKLKNQTVKLAFSEGDDPRVLKAVEKITQQKLIYALLVSENAANLISTINRDYNLDPDYYEVIDIKTYPKKETLIQVTQEIRKDKNTLSQIQEWANHPNYFVCMLVASKLADAALGGATYSTADTVKPALQIIGAHNKFASSYLMLCKEEKIYFFADCAINLYPNSSQLSLIAQQTAASIKEWGIEPRVALLSFSTKGSAINQHSQVVIDAYNELKAADVNFKFDGEMQFDCALVPSVSKIKMKQPSLVAGMANCFIFPNLDAGNIGYKIAQRLGNYTAVGPVIQGLKLPVNDLSRGCSAEDIHLTSIITANQALK